MPIKPIDRITLLNITFIVEAVLLSVATVWTWCASIQLAPSLKADSHYILLGMICGLGIALMSFVLILLGKFLSPLSSLREIVLVQIAPLFADLGWMDAILVAAASGFCEEVLFRGVLQAQYGIWVAGFIFGLFHCPSLKHISYGIWAFAAGLILGWLYLITGNLWTPVMAHAVSNGISLLVLRYGVKPVSPPS